MAKAGLALALILIPVGLVAATVAAIWRELRQRPDPMAAPHGDVPHQPEGID